MDYESIKNKIWELFVINKRPVCKSDINKESSLPSYNTCMRRGISLTDLNREFKQKYYYLGPKMCKQCSTVIPFESHTNVFCSHSCSATFNNTRKISNSKLSRCQHCGTEVKQNKHMTRKFCSNRCQGDFKFINSFLDWYYLLDTSFENKTLREFLRVWVGYKCSVCGISDWNNKEITLEVEHIDGNSENSSRDNVCLLCPNCHSQTPTYKGRNVGKGRHSRRERYRQGKSY